MSRFSQFTGGANQTGSIAEFLPNTNPAGYLALNGQCVCKAQYGCLYSLIGDQDPPASDSTSFGPISPPIGYICQCFYGTITNGPSCVIRFGVFHCICCSKLFARLCYITSGGVCGCIDETSGGVFNGYYGTCVYAPCNAYDMSVGYDCNTNKVYVAIPNTITWGFGTCPNSNYLRIFNITDQTSFGAFFCSNCYNQQSTMFLGNSCISLCCVSSLDCIFKICYPTASISNVAGRSHTFYCGACQCTPAQTCNFLSSPCRLFLDANGRNPSVFIECRGSMFRCLSYYTNCVNTGISVFDLNSNVGAFTSLGCSGDLNYLNRCSSSCCGCCIGGANFFGFYCDSTFVGLTGTHTAGYCICGGYAPSVSWSEPGKFRLTRFIVCKACLTSPAVFCEISQNSILTLPTFNQCQGPREIIYVPKCNMYHVNGWDLTTVVPCCNCCSVSYTCAFYASGTLPLTRLTNCLGICQLVCDSSLNFRSANTLPFRLTGSTLELYGASILGPTSCVFLIPNIQHANPALKYYIKT